MRRILLVIAIVAALLFVAAWVYQFRQLKQDAATKPKQGQVILNWGLLVIAVMSLVGALAWPREKKAVSQSATRVSSRARSATSRKPASQETSASSASEVSSAVSSSSSSSVASESSSDSSVSSSSSSELQVDFPGDVSLNKTGDANVSFKAPANTQIQIKDENNHVITTLNGNDQGADQTYNFKKPGRYQITAQNANQTIDKEIVVRGLR